MKGTGTVHTYGNSHIYIYMGPKYMDSSMLGSFDQYCTGSSKFRNFRNYSSRVVPC